MDGSSLFLFLGVFWVILVFVFVLKLLCIPIPQSHYLLSANMGTQSHMFDI